MENIEEAKRKVESAEGSWRSIAKEHGTNHVSLKNFAEKHGWNIEHRLSKNISKMEKKDHEIILGKIALRKMTEIKDELGDKYSPTDEPLIIMVSRSYEEYLDLAKKVSIEGYTCVSVKTGAPYLNPTFNAYQAVQKTLMTVSDRLGLSIASRKKLGLKFEKPGQTQKTIFDIVGELEESDNDLDDI